MISNACQRQSEWRATGAAVLQRLHELGDLVLLPDLLRKHEFAFGLFGKQARERYLPRTVLDRHQTEHLVHEAAAGWQQRMRSGDLLQRLLDPIPLFSMREQGLWDDACAAALRAHLDTPEAFDHFVLMFFGGHWLSEAYSVAWFFDRKTFMARLYERDREYALTPDCKAAYIRAAKVFGFKLEDERSYAAALESGGGSGPS
jgi:hypothetical protein